MGVGIGGLITDAMGGGNLDQRLANALAGPQPNPNPSPSPTGAPGQAPPSPAAAAPGQSPSQAYAPDPQNANTIGLLLKVHQQDAISNDLNRNIAGIAAGFGTAQQQHDKQDALARMGPGDDRLAALGQIEKITQAQTEQNNAAQFKAGAAGMASMFPGMTSQQLTWLSNNPAAMNELVASHIKSQEPTDALKTWTQMRQVLRDQGMSEDDINAQAPPSLIQGAGMVNLGDRQFLVGQQQALANNKKYGTPIPPQYSGDLANYNNVMKAQGDLQKQHADDLAESQGKFADQTTAMNKVETLTNSIQNATEADGKTNVLQSILDDPLKRAAAQGMVNASGDQGTVGNLVQQGVQGATGLTDEEKAVIANIKQLSSSQYATAFTSTGSRRTGQEVQNIAASLSQLSNFNQPYSSYKTAFDNLHEQNQTGQANAYGAAQRLDEVPDNLKSKVNPIYLPAQYDANGKQIRAAGPLYAGAGGDWATKAPTTAPKQQLPSATASAIDQKLKDSPGEKAALIQHFESLGYDMSKYK